MLFAPINHQKLAVLNTQNPNRTENSSSANLIRRAKESPGFLLLTLMSISVPELLAERIISTNHDVYPLSGIKPLRKNDWFEKVIEQEQTFVANSPDTMGEQFYDREVFEKLGCGSVINIPILNNNEVVGCLNLLHTAGYFNKANIQAAQALTPWAKSVCAEHYELKS